VTNEVNPASPPNPFPGHDYPQVLPSLAHVAPGGEPPWHDVPKAQREDLSLVRVRDAVASFSPVDRAGSIDAPSAPAAGVWRDAAVLVALFEEGGESRVLLTRRSVDLARHSGEVSFPGGSSEPGESAVQTALREAHEEIGLDPAAVTVIGRLSALVTFGTNSAIQPVVALLAERPALVANAGEVERIFDVALRDLLGDGNFVEQRWRRDPPRPGADADGYVAIYFFRVPGDVVWGATGRILTELLAVVTGTVARLPRREFG
jgi:8-oxo-dGTP pyrophosphatase MutT (NUDIX family)